MKHFRVLILLLILFSGSYTDIFAQQKPLYLDPSQPLNARVENLVQQMTLEEKVSQMVNDAPAIPRLHMHKYNWWNEALHGVGRSGVATVFPQAIGMAATFDEDLIFDISTAISDEARAMYNESVKKGYRQQYAGLTFWTPNINIFRDPRWGRGQETYGEDPYLTSVLGSAFVRGLQGDDPHYLKTAATAKHFAVHSGPEKLRHEFNAKVSKKDMYETYFPAFQALVNEGVETIMCAYNSVNGVPSCANDFLLNDVLRKQWNFKGHIVSDCSALGDLYKKRGHHVVNTETEAAALALDKGVNLNCGSEYNTLTDAVKKGLVSEKVVDKRLKTLLKTRFKLGMFDPAENNPYADLSAKDIDTEEHRKLARKAAAESIVMLKNDGVLPLKNNLSTYFVTGPNASSMKALLGNYHGINGRMVTIVEGLARGIQPGSQLFYRQGALLDRQNVNPIDWSSGNAKAADVTFAVLGLNSLLEGEEGASIASPYMGDRLDYQLPQNQIDYLESLTKGHDKPVVAIVTGGSPMDLAKVHELADAVLLVWYPGEEGGNAVADVVFGHTSPSGKLPLTFPKSLEQLPPYDDYAMEGRTYRYMKAEPLYPFGFGLSYTTFKYSDIHLTNATISAGDSTSVRAVVTNTGNVASDEVVQLYITDIKASVRVPLQSLKSFKRINLEPGKSTTVTFQVTPHMLELIDEKGDSVLEPGKFKIIMSGAVPTHRSKELGATPPAETVLNVQ